MNFSTSFGQIKTAIYARKYQFASLLLLQLIVIGVIVVISARYQVVLFSDLQSLLEPLQQSDFASNTLEAQNQALSKMLPLLQGYQDLVQHVRQLMLWLAITYFTGNALLWMLSFNLLQAIPKRSYGKIWLKFLAAGCGAILLISLLLSFISRSLFSPENIDTALVRSLIIFLAVSLAVYYIFLTAAAQSAAQTWKSFAQQLIKSLSKPVGSLLLFIAIIILLGSNLFLLFKLGQSSVLWAVLLTLILVVILVISRLVLINKVSLNHS